MAAAVSGSGRARGRRVCKGRGPTCLHQANQSQTEKTSILCNSTAVWLIGEYPAQTLKNRKINLIIIYNVSDFLQLQHLHWHTLNFCTYKLLGIEKPFIQRNNLMGFKPGTFGMTPNQQHQMSNIQHTSKYNLSWKGKTDQLRETVTKGTFICGSSALHILPRHEYNVNTKKHLYINNLQQCNISTIDYSS